MNARHPVALWAPVVAWLAAIYFLSSLSTLPGPPGQPDWLQHGLAYGGLAIVLSRALSGGHTPRATWMVVAAAWVLAVAYGVTDEWHQSFVPGRTPEFRDIVSDGAGAALALAAAKLWGIIKSSP